MAKYPIVLTIAGSDSSGGAGIQADIKTMSAIGVYAASAVTAVTAQNTLGVDGVQGIDPDMVARQIDAVFSDLRPDAVKIGMLYSRSIVEAVADRFCHWHPQNVVLDPVMISTSGSRLIEEDAVEAIKEKLFPFASLLTPNLMEAEHLTGIAIDGIAPAREAVRCIVEKGCRAALVKGGHLDGDVAVDVLFADGEPPRIQQPARRVGQHSRHGMHPVVGCRFFPRAGITAGRGRGLRQKLSAQRARRRCQCRCGRRTRSGEPSV